MEKLPVTLYASLVEWINKFSKNAKVGRFAVKLCTLSSARAYLSNEAPKIECKRLAS